MYIANFEEKKAELKQKRAELVTLENEKTALLVDEMNPFKDVQLRDIDETIQLCKNEIREITDLF